MQIDPEPQKDLVFVGGGHAHALVLRQLAMAPPAGLRITLISPDAFTPYSGMLPGLLAGHYTPEDTHIDLARLCQWAGVRFLNDRVTALDPSTRCLSCEKRGVIEYDILSIDIGSQPELDSVPGAREFATPVKPVADLWSRWNALTEDEDLRRGAIAVVGGGAGSVELALAIAHKLRHERPQIDLYCGAAQVLEGYRRSTRRAVERALESYGIALHCNHRVVQVKDQELHFEHAVTCRFSTLIWATGASAAPWIAESGLPVDERGFMLVNDTLQSTGYANVFGSGDIATQLRHPRPKAGVYAVRQGPVLAKNLLALFAGRALREHRPQRRFLSMLALGSQHAVAERNALTVRGAWVWRWKDRIDRQFMERFQDLPPLTMSPSSPRQADDGSVAQAPCGGCGAKVGADALSGVLHELRQRYPDHLPDAQDLDDAALIAVDSPLLQSVDGLRALIDDPWRMGRIAAQHALSDLYACGARPHSAQPILTLPFAAPPLQRRDLQLIMDGALSVFAEANCRVIGGHSMQGPELQIAFAVNGTSINDRRLSKRGGRPGDVLILTKALGSGVLFAGHMQQKADGRHIEQALAQMEAGNGLAAEIALDLGVSSATDITGFGLAGHLLEMLDEGVAAELTLSALPVLPGALELMGRGIFSTLHSANERSFGEALAPLAGHDETALLQREMLFDPQTSGGLLLPVPAEQAHRFMELSRDCGVMSTRVGELTQCGTKTARLSLC